MTIDEAIKHCDEEAEENEHICNCYPDFGYDKRKYEKCASEHRQLAEWLRELKAYRQAEKEIEQELVNWDDIDNGKCRGLFLATSIIQYHKSKKVTADE